MRTRIPDRPRRYVRRQVFVALSTVVLVMGFPLFVEAKETTGAPQTERFTSCRLVHPLKVKSIEAECMTIRVREGNETSSRYLDFSIARVPAVSSKRKNDPIVLLAGGPGMGAQLMYTMSSSAFARARRDRDILLIDQRGTGKSTPLTCSGAAEDPLAAGQQGAGIDEFVALTTVCRDSLARHHDLRSFTTSQAVRDLEEIRARLGYDRLNLYGVSYGSRVAQHYAREFPTRVRSMVLDGVVPPQTVLGPDIAIDAERAVEALFDRCRKESSCKEAFGDPRLSLREVQSALRREPISISLPHPQTGKPFSLSLGATHIATVTRLSTYDPYLAAMLPLVLYEASRANYRPLASLFVMTLSGVSASLAAGMHNSVVCSEDFPRFDRTKVDRQALETSYLGPMIFDALSSVCKTWPRGEVDKNFNEPLKSDIPTLLLSGTLDPVTPPSGAALVGTTLRNSLHVVIENSAHGQLAVPCIDRVFRDFFGDADPKNLDTSCLKRWVAPPFWTSLSGPPP